MTLRCRKQMEKKRMNVGFERKTFDGVKRGQKVQRSERRKERKKERER